ncbi:MAG: InlB B-repeat-containing protein [Bacteroidaceae bacterium]|nr:InlB B-repeat-containing protein [Bacteroidaceae bacterium]
MNKIKVSIAALLLMMSWATESWAQFNPTNPDEPSIQYKVELECVPADVAWAYGGGQFNDGRTVNIGSYCYNENYVFDYWECNGKVYSKSSSFMYVIKRADVKFIAHYKYSPDNPDEPNAHFMRRIYLKTEPEGIAAFNIPSGEKWELGTNLGIYETGRTWSYEFKGWYDGDELVSVTPNFYYTVPDKNVTLVAHYEFSPNNPNDPGEFYLMTCDILAEPNDYQMGSVYIQGLENGRARFGSQIILNATPYGNYEFSGWYLDDQLISNSSRYTFTVPSDRTRLYIVALFSPKSTTSLTDNKQPIEIKIYDLLGREQTSNAILKGPYIVREYWNGQILRTYKVIK